MIHFRISLYPREWSLPIPNMETSEWKKKRCAYVQERAIASWMMFIEISLRETRGRKSCFRLSFATFISIFFVTSLVYKSSFRELDALMILTAVTVFSFLSIASLSGVYWRQLCNYYYFLWGFIFLHEFLCATWNKDWFLSSIVIKYRIIYKHYYKWIFRARLRLNYYYIQNEKFTIFDRNIGHYF